MPDFRSQDSVATPFLIAALSGHETTKSEADMPFLFWMPMIVMCGMWRAAEEDARALFATEE